MNRRSFLTDMLTAGVGCLILPGANRIWRPVNAVPTEFDRYYLKALMHGYNYMRPGDNLIYTTYGALSKQEALELLKTYFKTYPPAVELFQRTKFGINYESMITSFDLKRGRPDNPADYHQVLAKDILPA